MSQPTSSPASRHRWRLREPDYLGRRRLSHELLVDHRLAQVLINRRLASPSDCFAFLYGVVHHDPFLFHDMEKAVGRIVAAIREGERIFVYGDYDVDGITGTTALVHFLRAVGADCDYKVPHRINDGYDLSPSEAEEAARSGYGLIITNDCGVTAHNAVARAQALGTEVIITDHHLPDEVLPPAFAVINATVPGSGYPFHALAGVTTVYKLICGLRTVLEAGPDPDEYLDLVALGTVADVCPLVDENRSLVLSGLSRLNRMPRLGLAALIDSANLGGRRITAKHLSYVLAPRLNAAGRISTADVGVELLLTEDPDEAYQLSARIEGLNRRRRSIESETTREAMAMAEDDLALEDVPVIVVGDPAWHPGVVGIVAARLADRFNRPAVVFGENGRGSARGFGEFDIIGSLDACAEFLNEYGGHRHAAGVRIDFTNLSGLRRCLTRVARRMCYDKHTLIEVDAEVELEDLDETLMTQLELLEPFGMGNPEPILLVRGAAVADKPRVVGKNHLKLLVSQGGTVMEAIGFNMADVYDHLRTGDRLDVVFHLERNPLQGAHGLQLKILDLESAAEGASAPPPLELDDHRNNGSLSILERCVTEHPTVIYCWPEDREDIQRYLARRGWLPATCPSSLSAKQYLFWDNLSVQPLPELDSLNVCLYEPLDGHHELLLLRELATGLRDLHLSLLFDARSPGRLPRETMDRFRLAEIWRNLPEDHPFTQDVVHELATETCNYREVRLALSIFLELGLMTSSNGSYAKLQVPDRRNLSNSFTYQRIREFESRRRRFLRQQVELPVEELSAVYFGRR
jgi:single-stranded-DNA-specific exonuclease